MLFNLAIITVSIIGLSFVMDLLLSNSVGKRYRIFVAPGVIVHELSHAFACFFTGAPITKISMFDKEGGEVVHGRSRVPVLGPIFISTAPFIAGALIIYFIARIIGLQKVSFDGLEQSFSGALQWVTATSSGLNFHNWVTWLLLYLVLSIAVTMTPSLRDLRNMFFSLIFVFALGFLIYRFTSFRPPLGFLYHGELLLVLSTILILLIFGLALSIIIFITSSIFKL